MVQAARPGERIAAASDAIGALHAALEEALEVVRGERGIAMLVDDESARLYAAAGVGVPADELARLWYPLRTPDPHPLMAAVRDGAPTHLPSEDLRTASLARLHRLGLDAATLVPVPGDAVVSACLSAGACLSDECRLRERTASASPDAEWRRRVGAACVRALRLRARGLLVLDAPEEPDERASKLAAEIAERAARALGRLPEGEGPRLGAPAEMESGWIRRAFAAIDDPIVAAVEGELRFANARARTLFHGSEADSEGRRRAVELNRMLLMAWLHSRLEGAPAERQSELSLVDPEHGHELLFELITSGTYDRVARQPGLIVILKDVSGIRHAVDELEGVLRAVDLEAQGTRRERDQLSLILRSIAQPVVVAEARGAGGEGVLAGGATILQMNAAAERVLSAPQRASRRARDIVRRNDVVLTSFLSQAGMSGGDWSAELDLHDPQTGEVRSFSARTAMARDEVGAPAALVCVLADLTELRELERRRLEHRLFESEKFAAAGRVAASIAHEINNPLEAVKNALYLLAEETPAFEGRRRFVDIARSETERISRIVRQILGFYRSSEARIPTDLNATLGEVLELLAAQIRKGRVRTSLRLEPGLPSVPAAPDQMKQVFLNLVLNAAQAMPAGGELAIATRLESMRRGDGRDAVEAPAAVVEFRDTGAGMTEETQARLFEPFFTTKERSGTGLGLWVCHEIVTAHGGRIGVTSAPDLGTTMRVELPVTSEQTP